MIGMSNKGVEKKQSSEAKVKRYDLRRAFWEKALEVFDSKNIRAFQGASPGTDNSLGTPSNISGCKYCLVFNKFELRVELYINKSNQIENKNIYDAIYLKKDILKSNFGQALKWERLDNKKACRISYSEDFESYSKENWPQMIEWLTKHYVKFEKCMEPILSTNKVK